MKYIILILMSMILISCNNKSNQERKQNSKAQVSVTNVSTGILPNYSEISGKTIYLNKNTIVSPISGYITKVNVREGDRISKGKILFEIQSPEAYVMQHNDSLKTNYGDIKIYAPASGIVSGLNIVQRGVFIDQGSALCLIIASGDLKVQADVPFEYRNYAKIGDKCLIEFPDKTIVKATFSKILPQMNTQNQTMKVLANLNTNFFIPEEMIVKVLIDKSGEQKTQILPKKCLMTDALMSEFWVMKLINDSTVVKTIVTIGNQTHTKVEITKPIFSSKDKFVSEGAYGLGDTALVEIID